MKSIVYILIAVFISSILLSAFPNATSEPIKTIRIQCVDNEFDYDLLNQSVEIIKSRLGSYGIESFEISVLKNQNSIEISLTGKVDFDEIKTLVTSKGKLEFYETHNRTVVIQQLEKDDSLFSLLNIPTRKKELADLNSSAILGYSVGDNKLTVDNYLNSLLSKGLDSNDIKFLWGKFPLSNATFELFLLRDNCSLSGNKVYQSVGKYYDSDKADIIISFTKEGAKIWQEMTKRNIDNSIAIVIDNEVYYAPKVIFEIKDGKCRISGDFSTNEVNKLISLINNGELPLNFELIQ